MANTGRIPLWLVGLVGGLAVITMLSLFIYARLNQYLGTQHIACCQHTK
jgi:hypothetical protein